MRLAHLSAVFVLLLAAPAPAQDANEQVDAVIERMKTATGEEYLKARAEGVALAPQAKDHLEQKAAAENWGGENWREALFASLLLGWSQDSKAFAGCCELKGVKPEEYRKRALPVPGVHRELVKLGKDAVPAMLEILLKTLDSYPLGTPEPGTDADAQAAEAAAKARKTERAALQAGIIGALARIADRRAGKFLLEVLEKGADDEIRAAAADAAAVCAGESAVAVLVRVLVDATVAENLRAACAHALGFPGGQAALDSLRKALEDNSVSVRENAAKGLACMASLRRCRTAGELEKPETQAMRKAAAAALVERLAAESDSKVRQELVQALGRIADASVLDALRQLAKDTKDESIKTAAEDAAERISKKSTPGGTSE
jgi:hypothetical protein